jgi:hypothetical protein
LTIFLLGIFATAGLAKQDWKEEQAQMFSQMGVKSGDVFDKTNIEKIAKYLPSGVVAWVKRGELTIKIGELKYDWSPGKEWEKLSQKNVGKYGLDENKEIIEVATGKLPIYVEGDLYPNIDFDNDPDAAIKFIHNVIAMRGRLGSLRCFPSTEWVGENGRERIAMSEYIDNYHWNRPDGEIPNRKQMLQQQLYKFVIPYDIRGMASLTQRFLDPKPDSVYAYVPSIRRIKKLSGANRSDPYAGSDFISDDSFGWAGKNASMKWTMVEKEAITLVELADWLAEKPIACPKQPDGSYEAKSPHFKSGYELEGSTEAPWQKIGAVWVPRKVRILEATALDPYYSYGKSIYHVDPYMGFVHKAVYNRAGEYWKTMVIFPGCYDWLDNGKLVRRITTGYVVGYVVVDEKTHHASVSSESGEMEGYRLDPKFMDPTIKLNMFEPTYLSTWSR